MNGVWTYKDVYDTVLSKRVRKKITIEFDWAITLIGLCGMMHCKTICYVQSHVAKPFVMYNRICKTFCYVQSYLAKPFVMYNHIWQNLLLWTTTFAKPFVMYNQPHFKAPFKEHGFAVCSYKLADFVFIIPAFCYNQSNAGSRSRNKHLSFAFGRFCLLLTRFYFSCLVSHKT